MTKKQTRSTASSSSTTRKTTGQAGSPQSTLTFILGAIVLAVSFIFSQCTGGETPLTPVTITPSTPAPVTVTQPPRTIGPLTPEPLTAPQITQGADGLTLYTMPRAVGASRGFWQVYFTMPDGSRDPATYTGGLDHILAAQIELVRATLDIAAYEFNSPVLTNAVIRAHQRGVRVRMVTDNEAGLNSTNQTVQDLIAAGIPVVDDGRSALMHNKFMILDSTTVWTGSWNYTINDTYRNNNSAIVLRSRNAVNNYQAEFDEMFVSRQFGPRSPSQTPNPSFTQDGIPISIYFSPEDNIIGNIDSILMGAQRSIRFMAFSFTQQDMGDIMLERARSGVDVRGIFERTGSETRFSQLTPMFCAGLNVRQDGNPFVLHHKVIVLDEATVMVGSFNFSANATNNNDENLVVIRDPLLAAQYLAEFERRFAQANVPTSLTC
jgi:phosphatidylserine/phosphatidylglycerophosphate/cardiolipin synthase-like enzyme